MSLPFTAQTTSRGLGKLRILCTELNTSRAHHPACRASRNLPEPSGTSQRFPFLGGHLRLIHPSGAARDQEDIRTNQFGPVAAMLFTVTKA